jgi:hypothetical protein
LRAPHGSHFECRNEKARHGFDALARFSLAEPARAGPGRPFRVEGYFLSLVTVLCSVSGFCV